MSINQDRPCTRAFFFANDAKRRPPNSFKITTYNLIQNKPLHPPVKSITFKKQGGGRVTNQLTPEENECCWRRCAAVSSPPVPPAPGTQDNFASVLFRKEKHYEFPRSSRLESHRLN